MRLACKHLHEAEQREREPALCGLGIERRRRWLRTQDAFDRRQHRANERSVTGDRRVDLGAPAIERRIRDDLGEQLVERRDHRAVRNVAVKLLELSGGDVTSACGDRRVELAHDRRLADPGVPGDQHGLHRAQRGAGKRVDQRADLPFTSVQTLGELEAARHVVLADRERRDRSHDAAVGQLAPAALEVGLQTCRGLIAPLGRLLDQLHHDVDDDPCRSR